MVTPTNLVKNYRCYQRLEDTGVAVRVGEGTGHIIEKTGILLNLREASPPLFPKDGLPTEAHSMSVAWCPEKDWWRRWLHLAAQDRRFAPSHLRPLKRDSVKPSRITARASKVV